MAHNTIPTEQLLAYAAGDLDETQRAEIEAQLAGDAEARATLKLFELARTAVSQDDTVAPPAHVIARAQGIYTAPQRAAKESWFDKAAQLVARLVFDSRTQPALAGLRSVSHACSLAYETDQDSVDVQAEPQRDADGRITAWQIVGQVEHDEDAPTCPVAFIRSHDKSVAAESTLDARGVFTLDLEPGVYEIRIGLPSHTIVVPQFDLS